jgi:hypothetical protein
MTTYTTTATGTDSTNNSVVLGTTANMAPGLPITFSGTTFGGIVAGDTYYILSVLNGTQITLSGTAGGAIVAVSTATGNMTASFTSGGQQIISTVPPGESLNEAFNKINLNFDQLFAAGPVLSNIRIDQNTIRTLNTNGNLVLAPNGIGRIVANVDLLPNTSNVRNLGGINNRWGIVYAQSLDLTGNISFSNLAISGSITANVVNANVASVTGNVTGGNFFTGGNVSAAGTVTAASFVGNISGNIDAAGNLTEVQFNDTGDVLGASAGFTFDKTSNVLTVTGNVDGGNLRTVGLISATGNVTGNYFFGNGSQLTGIDATSIQNGNSNVRVLANSNVTIGVSGVSNVAVFSTSGLDVTGNITAANLFGNITGNIVGPIPTSANILYVAKNGSDSNDGSINKPFLTIRAAMAVATAGTSVHVAPGNYTEINPITIPANVALIGDNLRSVFVSAGNALSDLFYMRNGTYVWGITIRDYLANGFSYDPATPGQNVFVSPYIQNITSSTTTGTAVYVDGNQVSSISTKAMILGFFTIINRGGIGVRLVNSAYSQAVNIYTIACDIGIKVESGAFITLNGSDCSIGNFGLVADGIGPLQTSGNTVGFSTQGVFVLNGLTNSYPHVNTVLKLPGDPEYYTIDLVFPNVPSVGSSTVIIQGTFLGNVAPSTTVEFFTRSSIIASAHTFEYVGAGTDPATALPQYGGLPIEANEVIQTNGGVITFTSTDQKGNFKVGTGFTINQATGEITGDYFYRSLFAQITPYILALNN